MTTSLLSLAAALTLAAGPASPARRVAVLDFNARWSGECSAKGLSEAQAERCEVLRLFADEARGGALAVLRPPAFVVMTRENTAQILKDMGGQCTEGECEVETARMLGAAIVVSGEVTQIEGAWIVTVKVHDVASAALLGTGKTRAKTKLDAFDAVRAETERMLKEAHGLQASASGGTAEPTARQTEPPGTAPAAEGPTAAPSKRWYGEVGAGALLSETYTRVSSTGTVTAKEKGFMGVIRAGWRRDTHWAFEGNLVMVRPEPRSYLIGARPFGVEPDPAYLIGASAAWSPAGNRWFSVALGAGFGPWSATLWAGPDSGAPRSEANASWISPYASAELRLDVPLGDLSLGLRTGLLVTVGTSAIVVENPSFWGSFKNEFEAGGYLQVVPVTLAARYAF